MRLSVFAGLDLGAAVTVGTTVSNKVVGLICNAVMGNLSSLCVPIASKNEPFRNNDHGYVSEVPRTLTRWIVIATLTPNASMVIMHDTLAALFERRRMLNAQPSTDKRLT